MTETPYPLRGLTGLRVVADAGHPANRRITSPGRRHIAKVYAESMAQDDVADAIATLFCAAPDLLKALRDLVRDSMASDFNECWDSFKEAEAAIERATLSTNKD